MSVECDKIHFPALTNAIVLEKVACPPLEKVSDLMPVQRPTLTTLTASGKIMHGLGGTHNGLEWSGGWKQGKDGDKDGR